MTTTILSAIETRILSTPDGIFRIRNGANSSQTIDILHAAEEWAKRKGIGSWVIFQPGIYDIDFHFEFHHIARIVGYGIGSTKLRRMGPATMFKSLWRYAMQDHSPIVGGFEIENMVDTDEPAILLGGQQNIVVHDIYSWGQAASFLRLENCEPETAPPPGRPFGTWTENVMLQRLIISGAKVGIALRASDPNRRMQSFSNLKSDMIQIALTVPGSIGIDLEDHILLYSAHLSAKANMEESAGGDCTFFRVGPECNVVSNHYEMFVEGRGRRIEIDPTSRVTGDGVIWSQNPETISDVITPGKNWKDYPSGWIEAGILRDQIAL